MMPAAGIAETTMGAFRMMDSYVKAMAPLRVHAIRHKLRHLPGAGRQSGPLCAHSCLGAAAARAKVRSSAASRSELVEFRRTRVHDLAVRVLAEFCPVVVSHKALAIP